MQKIDLKGIYPPIVTPFLEGEVSYSYLTKNIEKLNQSGIKGVIVLGSNGENVFLSEEEKFNVVKTVMKSASKDLQIIVGTGCESTRETIIL
ncbi:MAG: dihydrodipicolinate synthase family protein, partial [Candidatus Caldatribacteriota bacterium]